VKVLVLAFTSAMLVVISAIIRWKAGRIGKIKNQNNFYYTEKTLK